jgi:hypothetical protein
MIAASWCFVRFGESASNHYRVCAASEGFANITTFAHPPICDDRDITRSLFEICIAGCGAIDSSGHLWNAKTKNTP